MAQLAVIAELLVILHPLLDVVTLLKSLPAQKSSAMTAQTPPYSEVAYNLALALIISSNAPVLLLDGDLKIISASASFCRAFHIEAINTAGCRPFELGKGEWNVPQLRTLLMATAAGQAEIDAYEMDLKRKGETIRHLILNARKLVYADKDNVRVLLSITDVTDARLADKLKGEMIQEKAVLIQELQHRVANSLQIIASVLMQSARNVQSDEARLHLHDARNRIMSIATLQKQLAVGTSDHVELKLYLTTLCKSLAASMIHDPSLISLTVNADESITSADISVSLGLIVTELVINALKHAFPGGRSGTISVNYHSKGGDWTLSVSDGGIGMSKTVADSAGLGTSIVTALAKKLRANIEVFDNAPGTEILITHKQNNYTNHDADEPSWLSRLPKDELAI